MAAINMPNGPSNGDTHAAANGITYQFDGDKWVVYDDPNTSLASLFARDAANTDVYPVNAGDNLAVRNGSSTITTSLNSDGSIDFVSLNIDALPTLP